MDDEIFVPRLIIIRADRYIRGVDRSEGAGSPTRLHGYAVLKIATFSERKTAEHKEHGCIKESAYTGDHAVRGSTLDSSYGGGVDT
jgi:hypothetical protein